MSNFRCMKCDKEAINYTKFTYWLHLMSFIDFLHAEGNITQATYELMTDYVHHLQPDEVDECNNCDLLKAKQKITPDSSDGN